MADIKHEKLKFLKKTIKTEYNAKVKFQEKQNYVKRISATTTIYLTSETV